MTRLSFSTRCASISSAGSAVVPAVFFSSQSGRGFVMSITSKRTASGRHFSASRISSRWLKGQAWIW